MPVGRAAERNLRKARNGVLNAGNSLANLCLIAGKLLAEGHGYGVHQVGAAGLDEILERDRLRAERVSEMGQRGQQLLVVSSSAAECTADGNTSLEL